MYALGKHFARVDGVIGDSEAEVYYYHNDHLGSVRAVSDCDGEVVWSADYLPFGRQVEQESKSFREWHGFTGKAYDEETGFSYYNARWYDESTGRFVSVDPIKDGMNWYVYCLNNPLRYIDPSGFVTEEQEKAAIENGWNTQKEIRRNANSVGVTYNLGFDISDQEYAAFYMFSQGMQYEYSQLYELRATILDSVGHIFNKLSTEQKNLIYSINEQVEILEAYEGAAYSKGYKNVIESRNLAACTNFIPVFGTGQRIWEVFSGKELWSGYKYTTSERIFKGVFLAGELAAIGGAVYNAVKAKMPVKAAIDGRREGNWQIGRRGSTSNPQGYATELDWSIVSRRGETRFQHVMKHGINNLQKNQHGVFYGNPVETIKTAWINRGNLQPVTQGSVDIYTIPFENAGYSGGYSGQGENLNNVTIITKIGTNQIITGYPSGFGLSINY